MVRQYASKLSAFADFVEGAGTAQLDAITACHIREFYEKLAGASLVGLIPPAARVCAC